MRRYLISSSAMDWRIRPLGTAIRLAHPAFTQRSFRSANALLDRFLAGRWLGRSTSVTQVFVTRPDGTRLRLLVCRSRRRRPDAPVTGLLWLHGGGFALGIPEQDFIFGDLFCGDGSCVAVLPDYRRSTEAPYPAALEDCYLALVWMHERAEELGISRRQLFVGGDSAGGGLTAAVCLRARDEGTIPVAFQLPLYPMLDDRGITASSRGNDAPVWNTASNETAWRLYLRGVDEVPAYAAPARAEDLRGLPPACTFVGSIDPFRDETAEYVRRLRAAGVEAWLREFPGCFHAFDLLAYPAQPARQARRFLRDAFRHAQQQYFSG